MVADDDLDRAFGGAGFAADAQGFADAVEHIIGLVAHMRHVDAAMGAQRLAHRDHLIGRRLGIGGVVKAGGEAGGTLGQGLAQPGLHGGDFAVIGGAIDIALHGFDAQRHMAAEGEGIDVGGALFQRLGIFGETAQGEPALIAQQVERRRRALGHPQRRERDAAIAHHHGGDTLADLAMLAGGAAEHGAVIMGMGVDKAGGEGEAGGDDLLLAGSAAQIAHGDDALAIDRDIALEARRAGAVDDRGVTDDQVASKSHYVVPQGRAGVQGSMLACGG